METFHVLLALCVGNSPVTGAFPTQRPVMRSFDVFFDLRLNKRLSKHSWGWWSETPSRPLWRHCNGSESVITSHSFLCDIMTRLNVTVIRFIYALLGWCSSGMLNLADKQTLYSLTSYAVIGRYWAPPLSCLFQIYVKMSCKRPIDFRTIFLLLNHLP